jgi:hypothetical protein
VGDEPFVFTISLIFRAVAEGHVRGGVQRSVDYGGEGIAQLTVEEEPPLPLVGRRVGGAGSAGAGLRCSLGGRRGGSGWAPRMHNVDGRGGPRRGGWSRRLCRRL